MREKSISDFLSEDYKEYAMYVIESRAIPSCIDGFKPVHRKIIHVANNTWKNGVGRPMKVFQLAGKVANECKYHHGGASLENAIVTMAQPFKNTIPLLMPLGQYGKLREPQAGAPRYIETKTSEAFNLIYKDFDLLNYIEEEGDLIEPNYFLPIIPMVILNGSQGLAVGYKSHIINRNITDVIDSCLSKLKSGKSKDIRIYINGFYGNSYTDSENSKRWIFEGVFERKSSTMLDILDLPPNMTSEAFENLLDDLSENKRILSYTDEKVLASDGENILTKYSVKFSRGVLDTLDDESIFKMFKLREAITEIYSTLDENGKLKIFESVDEIIDYFINFRLEYYSIRKARELVKMNRDMTFLTNRAKFIKYVLDGKIVVNNQPKASIENQISDAKLDQIDGSFDYLLRMPIYSLTKEVFAKLKEDCLGKKEEIKIYTEYQPKQMYVDELQALRKLVSKK